MIKTGSGLDRPVSQLLKKVLYYIFTFFHIEILQEITL